MWLLRLFVEVVGGLFLGVGRYWGIDGECLVSKIIEVPAVEFAAGVAVFGESFVVFEEFGVEEDWGSDVDVFVEDGVVEALCLLDWELAPTCGVAEFDGSAVTEGVAFAVVEAVGVDFDETGFWALEGPVGGNGFEVWGHDVPASDAD